MRWEIINKSVLPEKMKKMQEEAIKQAKNIQSKSKKENKEEINNFASKGKIESNKKNNFKNIVPFNLVNSILSENDNILIVILIILLMDDEKNFLLLLILLYLLI